MSPLVACGFVHIPKTAGMSVRAALLDHYPAGAVGHVRFDDRLFGDFARYDTFDPGLRAETMLATDPAPDTTGRLLQLGHLSLQGMLRLLPAERTFTVLREPRARVLSHHLYWSVRPVEVNAAFGEYQVQRYAEAGLRAFLLAPQAAHQHDNLICRMLVDDPGRIPADGPIDPLHHAAVAAEALAAIDAMGLCTFVEDPAMWAQLSAFVEHEMRPVRVNETDAPTDPVQFRGPQLDADTVTLLQERTGADQLVYRAVVARRFGIDDSAARAMADAHFVAQAERYGRITAAAEAVRSASPTADVVPLAAAPVGTAAGRARRRWGRG